MSTKKERAERFTRYTRDYSVRTLAEMLIELEDSYEKVCRERSRLKNKLEAAETRALNEEAERYEVRDEHR